MSKVINKKTSTEASKKATHKSTKVRAKTQTTKCERCNKPFSYDPAGDKPTLCKECRDAESKIIYRAECKECGKSFYVKAGEAKFYKDHGLEMPKRCYECRNLRKIEKAKTEEEGAV